MLFQADLLCVHRDVFLQNRKLTPIKEALVKKMERKGGKVGRSEGEREMKREREIEAWSLGGLPLLEV